jgi:hypothetical protein
MSSPTSTASSTSPIPPATPLTPNSAHSVSFANQNGTDLFNFDSLDNVTTNTATGVVPAPTAQGGPVRRKPSRRANTAERRATHNAVERQRRETLNSRFLDLAALLPNLASVRRPSKSAIVNSSIALIHTQRRARSTAAKELRLLKLEADALRAEVNEWRERAGMGLSRIEEPVRSRDFEELVSGGLEESEETLMEEERRALEIAKEGLRLEAAGFGGDMLGGNFAYNVGGNGMYGLAEDDEDDGSSDSQTGRARPGSQGSNGSIPMPIAIPRNNSMHSNPMIFDPSAALLQAHPNQNVGIQSFNTFDLSIQQPLGLSGLGPVTPTKPVDRNMWNAQQFYNNTMAQQNLAAFNYAQQQQQTFGGFGFVREEDVNGDASSIPDMAQFPLMPQVNRTRSASTIHSSVKINAGNVSPPTSAPPTATTYAEANAAGDAFAAAYRSFPMGVEAVRVPGGGNTFHAAMGLFM